MTSPTNRPPLRSIEVFVGAGGLGLGLHAAGFRHSIVADADHAACETLRLNQSLGHPSVQGWQIHQIDARALDLSDVPAHDLLAAGPPCQPWAQGGSRKGTADHRDMWPTAIRLLAELRPKAFVFENVPNLATSFAAYFDYQKLQLRAPLLKALPDEHPDDHAARLRQATNETTATLYDVHHCILQASEFGTAQRRSRLFIVGLRADLKAKWAPPEPTHSREALFVSQWISHTYWHRHGLPTPEPDERTNSLIRSYRSNRKPNNDLFDAPKLAVRTLRDCIGDMPVPTTIAPPHLPQHIKPSRQARAYGHKHTGSPLDQPSKTLVAGVHGIPGGANFFTSDTGDDRHFTIREAARIQDFPDDFLLTGSTTDAMRQLGNAVPCRLAEAIGSSIAHALLTSSHQGAG